MLLNLTNLTNKEIERVYTYLSNIKISFVEYVISNNKKVLEKQNLNKEHLILGALEFLEYVKDGQLKFDMNPEYVKAFMNWLGCQSNADTEYLIEKENLELDENEADMLDHAVFNFYCEIESDYNKHVFGHNDFLFI